MLVLDREKIKEVMKQKRFRITDIANQTGKSVALISYALKSGGVVYAELFGAVLHVPPSPLSTGPNAA